MSGKPGPRIAARSDREAIADIRIRAANLLWMLEADQTDRALDAIAEIRTDLNLIRKRLHDRAIAR